MRTAPWQTKLKTGPLLSSYVGLSVFSILLVLMMLMYFAHRHEVQSTNTLSAQRRLVKTYRTKRFATALEAD